MTGTPTPEFGKPWAAPGEARPQHFRTPLAWVAGAGGGVLLVQDGTDCFARQWDLLSEWEAWVRQTNAAPVQPEAPEPPFDDAAC